MDTALLGRLRTIAAAPRERAPDQLNFHAAVNERFSLRMARLAVGPRGHMPSACAGGHAVDLCYPNPALNVCLSGFEHAPGRHGQQLAFPLLPPMAGGDIKACSYCVADQPAGETGAAGSGLKGGPFALALGPPSNSLSDRVIHRCV